MQVALELVEPPEHRMNVGILKGRKDHAPIDVDPPCRRGGSLGHLVERANRHDSVITDQDRLGRAARTQIDRSSGQKKFAHGDPEQRFNIPL